MISLVIGSVLIYGSLMPLMASCLLGRHEEVHHGKKKPTMKKIPMPEQPKSGENVVIDVEHVGVGIINEEEKENDIVIENEESKQYANITFQES